MLSIRRGVASYCCGPKLFAPLVSPWGGFPSEIRAKSSSTNNADTRQTDPNVTKEHLKRYTSLSSRNIDKLTPKQVSETWYSYFGSASIEDIDKHIREPNETKHAKADLVDFSMNMQGYQDDTEYVDCMNNDLLRVLLGKKRRCFMLGILHNLITPLLVYLKNYRMLPISFLFLFLFF